MLASRVASSCFKSCRGFHPLWRILPEAGDGYLQRNAPISGQQRLKIGFIQKLMQLGKMVLLPIYVYQDDTYQSFELD